MCSEHPRRTFYFIFIIFCDDFIIPSRQSFCQNCFSASSFFRALFFAFSLYLLHIYKRILLLSPFCRLCGKWPLDFWIS